MDNNLVNSNYKNIRKKERVALTSLVKEIPISSNCLISGGIELTSQQGGRVYNRKVILLSFIKQIINEYYNGVIVFYKSPYIRENIKKWVAEYNGLRKITFLDENSNYGLNIFGEMSCDEIIYSIKNIAKSIEISINQYTENFFYYIFQILNVGKFPVNFENILELVNLSCEELVIIAKKLKLKDAAKYFSKLDNGFETGRQIIKVINNFMEDYQCSNNKISLFKEIKNKNIIFIYVGDKYQKEKLEYFTEEIKCVSKYNPYIIFDDISIKNNNELEDLLIGSIGIRYCFSTMNLETMVSSNSFKDFSAIMPTKLLLHYNDANVAENIASSLGSYYHLKVTKEHSKSRDKSLKAMFDAKVTEGSSTSEEKRNILEGTDLVNLTEKQLYFIDNTIEKYFINNILFDR